MKSALLIAILFLSTTIAAGTLFSRTAKRTVLAWLGVGLCQSLFLLVIGFELLSCLNLLFVLASATVLQLYSAVFGTGAIYDAEKTRARADWIYGLGSGATIGAILVFAIVGSLPEAEVAGDLSAPDFARGLLSRFPELPWVMGVTLFLAIVGWATVGRPAWKRNDGGST